MFRAHGDPSRLRLLARLAAGEIRMTELVELEDSKITTISSRPPPDLLHEARLVRRRRKAKRIYYSLSDGHVLHLVESAMEHAAKKQ